MADPYEYVKSTGLIVPDTSELLTEVEDEYKSPSAFGSDLNVAPSTPQGVLIASEATARDKVVRNNAALANQINPNIAGGIFLDAIWALTGGQRDDATRTIVPNVRLTGVANTVVPAGSQAQTPGGVACELIAAVVIGTDNEVFADFRVIAYGPISVAPDTLTQIVSNVLGWETVNNDEPGVIGTLDQSDISARQERRNQLALQGQSLSEAITSGLYATEGVKSLTFRENVANTTQTIDGIELVAHSIWTCIDGGADADIAETLSRKKSGGCAYNGDEEVGYVDPFSGQTTVVKFDRPTPVPMLARATIRLQNSVVSNPEQLTKNAILTYAAGEMEGEPGFVVGASVSPFELSAAVNVLALGIFVVNMEIKEVSGPDWETTTIEIDLNEIATINESSITVVIE